MTTNSDTGTKPDPATPPAAEPDKTGGAGATLGDVKDMVLEAVSDAMKPFKDLLAGGSSGAAGPSSSPPASATPAAAGPDLGAMVDSALAKVLGDKDAADRQAAHDAEHAKLREAAAESKPVDRPRRSRWLGNIYDS